MPRAKTTKQAKQPRARSRRGNPFKVRKAAAKDEKVHVFGDGFVCDTDTRGYPTPKGRSPLEIVLDASEGFIPLWTKGVALRWRFRETSLKFFENPSAAKADIRKLLGDSLLAWGSAAPIKFVERDDAWDFEIVVRKANDCDANGCVLASAFFPDAGRHKLTLYPEMFEQSRKEQLETIEHEIGHVFGLRHFFADVSETAWPSQVFGAHKPFSIMNYGNKSVLTDEDRNDLKRLYKMVWSGELKQINGTPIKLVKPFHEINAAPDNLVAVTQLQPVAQPIPRVAFAMDA